MLAALRQGLTGEARQRVIGVYLALGLANLAVWGIAIAVFRHYPLLLGTCLLAYGFGLRHAVDADHIAAIDNVTRKLMQQGRRPVGVGLFFSLGHSTIVFALSAAMAAMAVTIHSRFGQSRFGALAHWGGIFGTSVSAAFLLAIAALNFLVLGALVGTFRRLLAGGGYRDDDVSQLLGQRGILARLFRGLFGFVSHSWQMYPIGFLFGLGFDTATEIGLLGISAAAASKGLPVWSIMVFPALFAAGMALVDTTDSVLMLGAYGWAFMRPARKLFYNIAITAVSVIVAVVIGGLELLGLIQITCHLSGGVWNQVALLNGAPVFGWLGYGIIGIFVLAWIVSVCVYKLKRYDKLDGLPAD